MALLVLVSIPFKRESVSKGRLVAPHPPLSLLKEFQFPSNGKVYPKRGAGRGRGTAGKVSIPFKRESVSKASVLNRPHPVESQKFQFPSNGKVYPKFHQYAEKRNTVEFQFPSNGKVYPKTMKGTRPLSNPESFNSLQTGKCIQRTICNDCVSFVCNVSIPFKRESVSKGKFYGLKLRFTVTVSIPFKRESVSKVSRTRRRIRKQNQVSIPFKRESVSKAVIRWLEGCRLRSFNSLQTGKCIQRCNRTHA